MKLIIMQATYKQVCIMSMYRYLPELMLVTVSLLVPIEVITGVVLGINVALLGLVTVITEATVAPTELILFILEELAAVPSRCAAYKMCCSTRT